MSIMIDMARNVRLWTPSYAAPTVGGKGVLCVGGRGEGGRGEGGRGGERYTIVEGYQLTIKRSNDPENTSCS